MTEDEFLKKRFKPFEIMIYKSEHLEEVECILLGIDFEERLFRLIPISEGHFEEDEFWANCDHCKRPFHKLKTLEQK